jgi:NNP family nitrate/nitrite transporter-like MFS transporter
MFRKGPAQRTLHLTWFAFFLSFVVWFNFAPFASTIGKQFHLSKGQLVTLGLCNLALTVPARIIIGGLLDRFGPRRTYSAILVFAVIPCTLFATAQSFGMLVVSRLMLGIVGAGFVVGIRMVSEWFPPAEVGTAEGIYGGWGNFGSAFAALTLPTVAAWAGGAEGWRWATGIIGVIAALFGIAYLKLVQDTPSGVKFARARKAAALEVTSRPAVFGLLAMSIPLVGALAVIAWRIWYVKVISTPALVVALVAIGALLAMQVTAVLRVNRPALRNEVPAEEQYPFRSVAVLSLAYMCTFGSELAAVSFLPDFFEKTWGLSTAVAGAAASTFGVMNLVTRPGGGLLSDVFKSRKRWLSILLAGLVVGFLIASRLTGAWPLALAIGTVLGVSLFAQAGNGAVYAIVPLVKKRVSGQIAGLAGAYGNVGGILFLAALLFWSPQTVFAIMAVTSLVVLGAARWLVEPARSHAGLPGSTAPEPAPVLTAPVDLALAGRA